MKKYIVIGAIVLVLLVGLGYWFMGDDLEQVETDKGTFCVVPKSYPTWNVDTIDWVGVATGTADYIGDKDKNQRPVLSFFKSINVQPTRALIRKYQKDIKTYIAANGNVPHWDIVLGEQLCA